VPDSSTALIIGLAAAYAVLLLIAVRHVRAPLNARARWWLLPALLAALAGALVRLLPAGAHVEPRYEVLFIRELTQPALAVILTNVMLVSFSAQALSYVQNRRGRLWAVAGLIWWAAQAVASATTTASVVGEEGWLASLTDPVSWPGVLAVGGWIALGAVLLIAAAVAFYRAHLSEIANKALFAAITGVLVFAGAALGASGSRPLAEAGWVIQFAGLAGAVYGVETYRIVDIRRTLRRTAAASALLTVTAAAFFAALVAARQLHEAGNASYLALAGLALAGAMIYWPLRALTELVVGQMFVPAAARASGALRQLSENITGVVDLDTLVDVTMTTLGQVLRVRRAGLILVSEENGSTLIVEPVGHGLGEMPDIQGRISRSGPITQRLLHRRAPMLQYDLDFGRSYASVPPEERRFFQQTRMSAYVPVVVQNHLIGILCCGAKTNDDPFTDQDLELLMTIANQVGVALRTARLVTDLRRRETEQAALNKALSTTTEQLEKLDSVKTDFITIASHELRTPLAQIRGYSEIMEAMNEDGMLDQDQIAGMTGNLRKAADRLETLIAAMLDVSELDVNAMDLRFAETTVESAMRMAIEPLTDAIRSRKLMLSARGLRDLPPIQADQQRLVQAFRNVVVNAVKYTPDGGRIEITGRRQDDDILIAIKDNGIGIDPANHDLIFEKFYRAQDPNLHSTGATKFMGAGPGLGLTIAKGVVEGHGGRIWVSSTGHDPENTPGSTFYILLPLTPPDGATRVLPFEASLSLSAAQMKHLFAAARQPSPPPPPGDHPTRARPPRRLHLDR